MRRSSVWRYRGAKAAGLVLVALVSSGVLVESPSVSAATSGVITHVPTGTIVNNRFVHSFTMDNGEFRVDPAPTGVSTPVLSHALTTRLWATSQVQQYTFRALGFGRVSVAKKFVGVRRISSQLAWIGLVQYIGALHCPTQKHPSKPKTPPATSGWAAVVLGVGTKPPDVVYTANVLECGLLFGANLVNATEMISVPWTGVTGGASVSLPVCATLNTESYSYDANGTKYLSFWATQIEDRSVPGCTGAHRVVVTNATTAAAGNPSTKHAPLGPVRMVAPGAP